MKTAVFVLVLASVVFGQWQFDEIVTADGESIYYISGEAKRHVFPNYAVREYFYDVRSTWRNLASSVLMISKTELEQYPIGWNITMRQGTKLLRIMTDSKVYAISHGGVLHWVGNDDSGQMASLYGENWERHLQYVPDVFFPNYVVGEDYVGTSKHPDGTLFRYVGTDSIYVLENGEKREFLGNSFAKNHFREEFVFEISPDFEYPDGLPVVEREEYLYRPVGAQRFRRGDANDDGAVDITDAIVTLAALFQGGVMPTCLDAADANDDGRVSISDPIYTLGYLFRGGLLPPVPGVQARGHDPTWDDLTCMWYRSK